MSPRKSNKPLQTSVATPAVPHRKPKPDFYTVLLAIALVAVLLGILFLYLEMNAYEFDFQGGPKVVFKWLSVGGQRPVFGSLIPNP